MRIKDLKVNDKGILYYISKHITKELNLVMYMNVSIVTYHVVTYNTIRAWCIMYCVNNAYYVQYT